MTDWNSAANLPSGIDTGEKLLAMAILAMTKMYAAKTYTEIEGQAPAPVITASIVRTDDGKDRLVGRYSLPLINTWSTDENPLWQLIDQIGTVDWPAEYNT